MFTNEFNIKFKNSKILDNIVLPKNENNIQINEINRYHIEKELPNAGITISTISNQNFSLTKVILNTQAEAEIGFKLTENINFIFTWDKIKITSLVNNSNHYISGNIAIMYQEKIKQTIHLEKNSGLMFAILTLDITTFIDTFKEDYYITNFPLFQHVYKKIPYQLEKNNQLKFIAPVKNIIEKCFHNPFVDKIEAHYIYSKIHGLISLIHEFQIENKSEALNEESVLKLNQARQILIEHLSQPPTIKELSKKIALNELKLKQGFKELFGCTIHNYSIKLRMEKAQSLMNESNLLIFEVAIILGYKDTSHFINVFKKYFGYTPKFFCTKIKTINIANE